MSDGEGGWQQQTQIPQPARAGLALYYGTDEIRHLEEIHCDSLIALERLELKGNILMLALPLVRDGTVRRATDEVFLATVARSSQHPADRIGFGILNPEQICR